MDPVCLGRYGAVVAELKEKLRRRSADAGDDFVEVSTIFTAGLKPLASELAPGTQLIEKLKRAAAMANRISTVCYQQSLEVSYGLVECCATCGLDEMQAVIAQKLSPRAVVYFCHRDLGMTLQGVAALHKRAASYSLTADDLVDCFEDFGLGASGVGTGDEALLNFVDELLAVAYKSSHARGQQSMRCTLRALVMLVL